MHYKVWDEIIYPFLNFNSCTVEDVCYYTGEKAYQETPHTAEEFMFYPISLEQLW